MLELRLLRCSFVETSGRSVEVKAEFNLELSEKVACDRDDEKQIARGSTSLLVMLQI